MSKELEAFDRVWEDCSKLDLDYVSKHNLMDDLREIKKALTPLTADEVREALQIFWGNNYKVNVSITNQIFIESKKDKDGDSCIEWDGEKIYFDWMPCYPPHLITLIGRFYEGLEKVSNE
jgi:hypothetical protein